MSLYAILYTSDALHPPSADDLAGLLARARQSNAEAGVTGQLVYIGRGEGGYQGAGRQPGHFVQWLEGPEPGVCALYRQIEEDPRHRIRHVAYAGPIRHRLFPTWTMAFRRADYNPGAASLELARLLELAEVPDSGSLPPAPTL
ncbi:MAG: BLUF domain-containing protein [Rubricoccaceae bacterium]|nr:BLUF domain-containing protein [Rubricoccaceae bacterium]